MTDPNELHTDPEAEIVVAGCAIHTPEGSRLAHLRLNVTDFHDEACARLFACTPNLPTLWPDYHADPWAPLLDDLRITAAAAATNIPEPQIRLLLQHRAVLIDATGIYAARILEAAERRHLRRRLIEALELVDNDDFTRAAGLLADCQRIASEAA